MVIFFKSVKCFNRMLMVTQKEHKEVLSSSMRQIRLVVAQQHISYETSGVRACSRACSNYSRVPSSIYLINTGVDRDRKKLSKLTLPTYCLLRLERSTVSTLSSANVKMNRLVSLAQRYLGMYFILNCLKYIQQALMSAMTSYEPSGSQKSMC